MAFLFVQGMRLSWIVNSGCLLAEHEIEINQVENVRIIELSSVIRKTKSQVDIRRNIEKRFWKRKCQSRREFCCVMPL
jgi:hypothetical protein